MNDLGTLPDKNSATGMGISPNIGEDDSKPSYPSLTLDPDQVKSAGLDEAEHGDVYELKVRVKVTEISSKYGSDGTGANVSFDVVEAEPAKQVGGPADEDEGAAGGEMAKDDEAQEEPEAGGDDAETQGVDTTPVPGRKPIKTLSPREALGDE